MLAFGCTSDRDVATAPANVAVRANAASPNALQPHLMGGIRLSSDERSRIFLINRRYHEKVMAIQSRLANPEGPLDPVTANKLRSLRQAQLVEMRAAMSLPHALLFDQNRSLLDARLADLRAKHGRH
jgi:hypothetical protein